VNFILTVGDNEMAEEAVNVRTRDDNKVHGMRPLKQLVLDMMALRDQHL
jgi:threonyl-tRNA synthetase